MEAQPAGVSSSRPPGAGVRSFGSSHEPFNGTADDLVVRRTEVERFLSDVNHAFPALEIGFHDVSLVHRGLLPSDNAVADHVKLLKISAVRDHRADGVDGLISILGVRYTTARDTAQRAIDTVCRVLSRPVPPCRTSNTPLVGGNIDDFKGFLNNVERAETPGVNLTTRRRLALSYGSTHGVVLQALLDTPTDRAVLGASCDVTRGEVRYAVRAELAVRLADAVMRRTEAGSAGHPGYDALRSAAQVMADELRWSPRRIKDEISDVERLYAIPD